MCWKASWREQWRWVSKRKWSPLGIPQDCLLIYETWLSKNLAKLMRWDLYSVSQQKPDIFSETLHKCENIKSVRIYSNSFCEIQFEFSRQNYICPPFDWTHCTQKMILSTQSTSLTWWLGLPTLVQKAFSSDGKSFLNPYLASTATYL